MSPADRFWLRVHRRVAQVEPDVASALIRAFQIVRERVAPWIIADLVARSDIQGVVNLALSDDVLAQAFAGFRDEMRRTVERGVRYFARDVPTISGAATIGFNVLAPRVVDAIRGLDTRVFQRLTTDTREVVRAFVENGLRDGVGPRTIAQGIRDVVGLAPNQLDAIANLRTELTEGRYEDAAARALLDRRFNLEKLSTLSADARVARIDTIVETYRKSFLAFHAETVARTATLDAFKQGQSLAWQDAREKGLLGDGVLYKTWHGVLDDREREGHLVMEGETVPDDHPYSNGQMIPGDTEYNCRCLSIMSMQPV